MFCCTLLYVHSSIAIILMGKRELVALLNLSSWCLVVVERVFLAVPWGYLRFVLVVFPDHTRLLFLKLIHLEHPFCLAVCLVQRSQEEIKKSNPQIKCECDWNIVMFDNFCLQFIIMDDYMQLLHPT